MFDKSPHLYDLIYQEMKDYDREASKVADIVEARVPGAQTLLDVACGTGLHLRYFMKRFQVEGLDLDLGLLKIAQERLGSVALHVGDMGDFDLGRKFDVVTCLFSAIGYCGPTVGHLNKAIARMAAHLAPGGLVVVEPWFTPDEWLRGQVHARFVDKPDLKIARMTVGASSDDPRDSTLQLHYLVGTPQGVEAFMETHATTLFTSDEYQEAFRLAGLVVEHDPDGLMGRGLYIGSR
ncbi:MAG: class I SAM-dependent methyltransferase [Actinomycetota bacterium]|nr:class I SAM-dependent methyltransferase [Actinomycetota bacterium]